MEMGCGLDIGLQVARSLLDSGIYTERKRKEGRKVRMPKWPLEPNMAPREPGGDAELLK